MGDKIDEALQEGYWTWKVARDGDGPNKMFPAEMRAALAAAGLAIVPVEPTERMLNTVMANKLERIKAMASSDGMGASDPKGASHEDWQAMLRAVQERGE